MVVSSADDEDESPQNGVVSARSNRSIQVAIDNWISGDVFDLDLAGDEVSRNRERLALQTVSQARGRLAELRQIILGELDPTNFKLRQPRFLERRPSVTLDGQQCVGLNAAQREAIRFALSAEDIAIIHGPPGTGKTTSVVEFIRQAVARGETVLACAPSNTAVDNLLERLAASGQRVVRVGHPARVKEELRIHTLDAIVAEHENMRVVRELLKDAEALYQKADRYTRAKPARGAKQDMRRKAKDLKAESRQLERQAINHVLDIAEVICATTAIDDAVLGDRKFDWVVLDEACQTTEPASWIPLMRGERILLAGDHCQLPPTVVSKDAGQEGLARSMMERLVETYGEAITRRLDVQYRMHEAITRLSRSRPREKSTHESYLSDWSHGPDRAHRGRPIAGGGRTR